ncbi:phosphatidylinositol 4-kinase gamma 4-like [Oryza glaberrima]|uniref:1-phosphatidylinositol 4-kinase n=1 Tax=Oryza glaberrima TaxID=4538 RepID=I1NLM2_ORYGL|nr:phosphatidylinositol 4-kinase gamma 4-like [Oryza glaberrima]
MASTGIAVSLSNNDALDLAVAQLDGDQSSYHHTPEVFLLYLAVPGVPLAKMQVLESDSVAAVKLRIQNSKGFVARNQRLVFEGRELSRNDSRIRDYGVRYGSVLHLVIRLSDPRRTAVRTVYGRKFKFQVDQRRNARYMKQEISRNVESPNGIGESVTLVNGEKLDESTLISTICETNTSDTDFLANKSENFNGNEIEESSEQLSISSDIGNNLQFDDAKEKYPLIEPVLVNPSVTLTPKITGMIEATLAGLEMEHTPVMSSEGTGGVYFMLDSSGQEYVAIFKPINEEPMAKDNPNGYPLSSDGEGLKRGTRVGEGAFREVAAYILDHPISGYRVSDELGFAGVPPTVLVRCLNGYVDQTKYDCAKKEPKIGSLQMFVKNSGSCEEFGPRAFPVQEVHKIAVLDMRLANADRHGGNILIRKDENGQIELIPIDHGYCLPESFEDCTFDWLYWPQARQPFNVETLDYIKSLDEEEDIKLLKLNGCEPSSKCVRVFRLSTMMLKKGAVRGLTPYEIGNMLCRENITTKSKIEEIVEEAEDVVLPGIGEKAFMEAISGIMDRHLNELFK